ncbi:HAMP domain-containing histidine kinase [Candidatus Kaiserbacteria bacterium]|nr:HAMP domain-containing histidine kinase [Candidatus Kaiserbacteria bacterium]
MDDPLEKSLRAEITDLKVKVGNLQEEKRLLEKDKNEYTQNVAHQLAAPINAIKMNIESLSMPKVSIDRKQVLLRSVYSQGTILAHLIKNFSLMSNLEADHELTGFREQPESFDLYRLCTNLSNDFQPVGKYKDQSIWVNEDEYKAAGYPQAYAIKNLFAQVVYNLLENATKYAEANSRIVIGLRVSGKIHGPTVTSQGLPIPNGSEEEIFKRGVRSRSEAAKRLNPAGTGFGLYIARRIMEIHKGTLTVETKNRVSTFVIQLPKK